MALKTECVVLSWLLGLDDSFKEDNPNSSWYNGVLWFEWQIRDDPWCGKVGGYGLHLLEWDYLGVVNVTDFSYCRVTLYVKYFVFAFFWTLVDFKAWDSRQQLEDSEEEWENLFSWGIRLEEMYLAGGGR